MKRSPSTPSRRLVLGAAATAALLGTAAVAVADSLGPIRFEPPAYTVGTIDGQRGWAKAGPYDVAVVSVAGFPAAAGYGFGTQALRISDAVTSGAFGNQTFSPGVKRAAGESIRNRHFEAKFRIGSASATHQPGMHMSVSPDDGQGSRMSYLRFEDQPDGIHVFFSDVTNPGPLGTVSDFSDVHIRTLSRTRAHRVRFSINLKPGPGNDVVRIYIDGRLVRRHRGHEQCTTVAKGKVCVKRPALSATAYTGTTWENYYRFDPEQNGNGNVVPVVRKLLFRESGGANPANAGKGFLIDGVRLNSTRGLRGGR